MFGGGAPPSHRGPNVLMARLTTIELVQDTESAETCTVCGASTDACTFWIFLAFAASRRRRPPLDPESGELASARSCQRAGSAAL